MKQKNASVPAVVSPKYVLLIMLIVAIWPLSLTATLVWSEFRLAYQAVSA